MNSCMFVGNIGKDAELSQAGNTQICKFSIANTTGFGNKKATMWLNCNLWGKRGESLVQYLTKGSKVVVIGELSENEYNGKTYLQVNVDKVELVGGQQQQQQFQPQQQQQQQQQFQQQAPAPQQQQSEANPFDSIGGNMPF